MHALIRTFFFYFSVVSFQISNALDRTILGGSTPVVLARIPINSAYVSVWSVACTHACSSSYKNDHVWDSPLLRDVSPLNIDFYFLLPIPVTFSSRGTPDWQRAFTECGGGCRYFFRLSRETLVTRLEPISGVQSGQPHNYLMYLKYNAATKSFR